MIDAIQVDEISKNIYFDTNGMSLKYLNNINKINIFIGENNSGKSRMMRSLINSNSAYILSDSYGRKNVIRSYRESIIRNIEKIIENGKEFMYNKKEESDCNFFYSVQQQLDVLKNCYPNLEYPIHNYIEYLEENLRNLLAELSTNKVTINKKSPIYIPVLRGIENFNLYFNISENSIILDSIEMNKDQRDALEKYKNNANYIYQNKIKKAYNVDAKLIFTAENLYNEITDKLLGEEKGRRFITDFQNFISKEFYNNKEFTLIPQKKEGYLNVKIGDQERPLHNLGDGIKQLITILYKIFEYKDEEKIFFIEEPELNLHPGFQRRLMEILQMDIFNKHQYFVTTHSNHFIDSCFDYDNISIYKFINVDESNNKFIVEKTSHNDISLLQELGVNNSSVFIANCTIWVEGISDKILIKKYLEVYFKKNNVTKYREDINYAFVEYGGNNITHWDFVPTDSIETINSSGITNRSFIICDNDNDAKEKKKRKDKLKKIFKDNYYELTVREIENTISKQVLDRTLFNGKDVEYKRTFSQRDYTNKETYMGKFIDEHYDLKRKYSNTGGSGTISQKLEFSKNIVKNINSYTDLTPQAQKLCKKIFEFIDKSNK